MCALYAALLGAHLGELNCASRTLPKTRSDTKDDHVRALCCFARRSFRRTKLRFSRIA